MASLLTNAEKNAYGQVFNNLHDTFARDIIVWKTPDRVSISTSSNYNFLYLEQPDIQNAYVPISGVFKARIKWNDPTVVHDNPEIHETIRGNTCRIKVKAEAIPFISGAEKIEIDGRPFSLVSSTKVSQLHGLFSGDFYNFFLEESL